MVTSRDRGGHGRSLHHCRGCQRSAVPICPWAGEGREVLCPSTAAGGAEASVQCGGKLEGAAYLHTRNHGSRSDAVRHIGA